MYGIHLLVSSEMFGTEKREVQNFICLSCARRQQIQKGERECSIDGGELQVEQFCYQGDVINCDAGVERTARMRVAAA